MIISDERRKQVIKPLRTLVYSGCRIPPIGALGRSYYSYVSQQCANTFSRDKLINSVRWFGGALDRCVPGVSDLDFLLFSERSYWQEEEITRLRLLFNQQKRKFPVLGEVHLTTPASWQLLLDVSPASLLWLLHQRAWTGGLWIPTLVSLSHRILPESRLALCLNHKFRAMSSIFDPKRRSSALAPAFFAREISKSIDLSFREKVSLRSLGSQAEWLADAYLAHQALLREKPGGEADPRSFDEIDFGKDSGSRFAHEMVGRQWNRFRRKSELSRFPMEVGSVPHTCIWRGDDNKETLVSFFEIFLRTVSNNPVVKGAIPAVLSPSVHHTYLAGWAWGALFSHWEWIPLPDREDLQWRNKFLSNSWKNYLERGTTNLFFLPGKFLYSSADQLQEAMKELCLISLSLATGKLTKDESWLMEEGKKDLPETVEVLRSLSKGRADLKLLIRHGLNLLDELTPFFYSFT